MNGITVTRKNNETITVDGICSVSINNENAKEQFLIYLSIPNEIVENDLVKVYISKVYDDSYMFPEEDECLFTDELWSKFKPILFEIINGENTSGYKFEQIVGKNFKISFPRKPATAISDEKLQKIKSAQEKSGVDTITSDLSETPAFESNQEQILDSNITSEPAYGNEINMSNISEDNVTVENNVVSDNNEVLSSNDINEFDNNLSDEAVLESNVIEESSTNIDNNNDSMLSDNSLISDEFNSNNDILNNSIEEKIKPEINTFEEKIIQPEIDLTVINEEFTTLNSSLKNLVESMEVIGLRIAELKSSLMSLELINDSIKNISVDMKEMSHLLFEQNSLLEKINDKELSVSSINIDNNDKKVADSIKYESNDIKIDKTEEDIIKPEEENSENVFIEKEEQEKTEDVVPEINDEISIAEESIPAIEFEENDQPEEKEKMSISDLMGNEEYSDENLIIDEESLDNDITKEEKKMDEDHDEEYIINQNIEIPTDGTNILNPFNIDEE